MTRETSMEHYDDLRKLENEYEAAKSQIKSYRSMETSTVLLLFLLFIVPGIIYVNYKKCQKMDIDKNNLDCKNKMLQVLAEAKEINPEVAK